MQSTCCTEFLHHGLHRHNNVSASPFICLISHFIFVAFYAVLYISLVLFIRLLFQFKPHLTSVHLDLHRVTSRPIAKYFAAYKKNRVFDRTISLLLRFCRPY